MIIDSTTRLILAAWSLEEPEPPTAYEEPPAGGPAIEPVPAAGQETADLDIPLSDLETLWNIPGPVYYRVFLELDLGLTAEPINPEPAFTEDLIDQLDAVRVANGKATTDAVTWAELQDALTNTG